MIKSYSEAEIHFEKELNKLDKFVLRFLRQIGKIKYVIISGYVAIFFGRTRGTEDIDMFINPITFEKFKKLSARLKAKGYWFINGNGDKGMFENLEAGVALRVAKDGRMIPNIEFKFAIDKSGIYAMNNRMKVICSGKVFYTSPLEHQIAYKLGMGSKKDIEDAYHLYRLFEKFLDKEKLKLFIKEEGAEDNFKKWNQSALI